MSGDQVGKLREGLEADGFTIKYRDPAGVIASFHGLSKELEPGKIKNHFDPTLLDIYIAANGLILMCVFGWYDCFDIQSGEDAELGKVIPVLEYVRGAFKKATEEGHETKLVGGLRKCFFEHPGAYEGSF